MMDGMTLPPSPMQALQAEHERLLGRLDEAGGSPIPRPTSPPYEELSLETQALIQEARTYVERCRTESEWISDGRDRSQLRANLRFWASFLLNCTGVYPDTTLRPANPFVPELSGLPRKPTGYQEAAEAYGITPDEVNAEINFDQILEGEQDAKDDEFSEEEETPKEPTLLGRLSRSFGLFAILIVGVIPLVAVCLALSLFYNLDNQSPWVSSGNPATQTASARLPLPSATASTPIANKPDRTPNPAMLPQTGEMPRLIADVSIGEKSQERSNCAPVILLSLDAPKEVSGTPIPAGKVFVYRAGMEEAVASGMLEPGRAPLRLTLEEGDRAQSKLDWLVQVDHPWLGVDAVILSATMFENCDQNGVSIIYRSQTGLEDWQRALEAVAPGDLSLRWRLVTWGPDALGGQDWVAVVKLEASGGNQNFVYFAQGDLAAPSTADLINGILSGDQIVLGQERCVPAVAQVGATSAGQSMSRVLAVQHVLPECR